jgi:SAM-dependent methyltransferase
MRTPIKEFVEYARDEYDLMEPVLDVCAGWEPNYYEPLFGGKSYLKQDQQQFDPPTIDFVCDVHRMEPIADNSIGTVLLLEALEHIREPQLAISEVLRILKPGGFCIATTLMTFEIHRCPYDYWRFCPDGMCYLFREFLRHELVLEHHRALPRGIWILAQKQEAADQDISVWPKVRVSESGKNGAKNMFKKILNRLGYDLVQVPKNAGQLDVIGERDGIEWRNTSV